MARRGGKAANRRDRQRRAQRKALQRPGPPARPIASVVADAVDTVAESRSEAVQVKTSATPSQTRGARSDPRFAVAGPSRLSERAAAEYHYVRNDLRNIAILVVVMAVLLAGAVVAFSMLKIGPH